MNKEAITIFNHIESISFIDLSKMEEYKKFLIKEISKFNRYDQLIKYLKNFCSNKCIENYNYSNFIKKYYNNKVTINKLYVTNNTFESAHAKLNYFLTRHVTNQYNFVKWKIPMYRL